MPQIKSDSSVLFSPIFIQLGSSISVPRNSLFNVAQSQTWQSATNSNHSKVVAAVLAQTVNLGKFDDESDASFRLPLGEQITGLRIC
jgi:hypothetical protein